MRLRCLLVAVLLWGAAAAPAAADRGGFVIRDFHVELEVEPNAGLAVEERVVVDFWEPRHGIYRTIPVRYTDPRGFGYSLGLRFLGAFDDDGRALRTAVTNAGRYVKIRIGSPDVTVRGRVVYLLRYRVRDALAHFPDHDELYWNATGNEWQAPIERASVAVTLPSAVERADLELVGYTGRFGSREQAVGISQPAPGTIAFAATRPLEPLEGLTVAVAFPPGVVRFPSTAARVARFLVDNWILLAPLGALGLLAWAYRRTGRDPVAAGSIVVRYEAPPGIRPGELGTLVDEKVDLRDVTATVVDLAVRGYLKIEIEPRSRLLGLLHDERTSFERTPKTADDLLAHESLILSGLFARGPRVDLEDLKERFYKNLPGIRKALYERMVARGYFAGNPATVRRRWMLLGVAAGAAVFGLGVLWVRYRGGILPPALIAPAVAGGLTAVLFLLFARGMPRRTRRGAAMRAWALGFEEFVDRVESERLEADRARNVFESLLPFAMALGVAAAWARRFEGVYEQAGPAWFGGVSPGTGFSTRGFEHSLSSAMTRTATTFASAPRSHGSSGFGGGGFSGGGGGGGGGGSW